MSSTGSADAPPTASLGFPLTQLTPPVSTQAQATALPRQTAYEFPQAQVMQAAPVAPSQTDPVQAEASPSGREALPVLLTASATPPTAPDQAVAPAPPAAPGQTIAPPPSESTSADALAAPKSRRTRRSRKKCIGSRGAGFSPAEVKGLLDLIEQIKPIARDEWETIARLHNAKFAGVHRTRESLRRKFGKLYRTNMGTGNPHIPAAVERAIRIARSITDRTDMAQDDDIDGDAAGLFDEDDADELSDDAEDMSDDASGVVPAARPLVLPRSQRTSDQGDDGGLLSVARVMMLQEQHQREMDREQQRQWREEDRRQRAEERAEERERSNRLFELLATAFVGVTKSMQQQK